MIRETVDEQVERYGQRAVLGCDKNMAVGNRAGARCQLNFKMTGSWKPSWMIVENNPRSRTAKGRHHGR